MKKHNKASEKLLLVSADVWVENNDSTSWKPCERSRVFVRNFKLRLKSNKISISEFHLLQRIISAAIIYLAEADRWWMKKLFKSVSNLPKPLQRKIDRYCGLRFIQQRWSIQTLGFFFPKMTSQAQLSHFARAYVGFIPTETQKLVSSMNHWIARMKTQTANPTYLSLLSAVPTLTQKVFSFGVALSNS